MKQVSVVILLSYNGVWFAIVLWYLYSTSNPIKLVVSQPAILDEVLCHFHNFEDSDTACNCAVQKRFRLLFFMEYFSRYTLLQVRASSFQSSNCIPCDRYLLQQSSQAIQLDVFSIRLISSVENNCRFRTTFAYLSTFLVSKYCCDYGNGNTDTLYVIC